MEDTVEMNLSFEQLSIELFNQIKNEKDCMTRID
jgi:hypothetical protein